MHPDISQKKAPYPPAAALPTQNALIGMRFDFNEGARLTLPEGNWRVVLKDSDTGNVLFAKDVGTCRVSSAKRYFVRFSLEVFADSKLVFQHDYDARNRDVAVQFPVGTLGDTLAWFPYASRFAAKHGCRLTCVMSGLIIPLLQPTHPHIRFVTQEEFVADGLASEFYATYYLGLFFEDKGYAWQPTDFRLVGLHRTAAYVLGVDPGEQRPDIAVSNSARPLLEPYVCIGVQSSTQCKYWNNPNGWRETIAFIRDAGYRVVCIDQKAVNGAGVVFNHIPHGVEDETGDRPLIERANWLKHANFFVGLSSGLSWLAWACGIPVVMISGFTHPLNEFSNPHRVINWHSCNCCWHDPNLRFEHDNFLWCPRHSNTSRQFECSRLITAAQVQSVIGSIPGFGNLRKSAGTSITQFGQAAMPL